ncbi:MAG: universal stress protein [Anaerolineae bacterium]
MSAQERDVVSIRRIVVAADGSAHSLATLHTALELAALVNAELEALFVEELDLLRLADLPCSRIVSLALLQGQPADRAGMERQLRLQAARVRSALNQRASSLGVRAHLRTVRGDLPKEVAQAAAGADLIGLGKAGHGPFSPAHVGTALRAALTAGRPLLLAERGPVTGEGLLAVLSGIPADVRALALARRLAAARGERLTILLPEGEAEGEHPLAWAGEIVWRRSRYDTATSLSAAAARARPALVVLALADDKQDTSTLARILSALRQPLLFVP